MAKAQSAAVNSHFAVFHCAEAAPGISRNRCQWMQAGLLWDQAAYQTVTINECCFHVNYFLSGEHKKYPPPVWLVLIFQQCMQIFARDFTQQLITSSYLWLCCLNQSNPPFLSIRASCRAGCKRTVPGSLKLSRFEPTELVHLNYIIFGCHAGSAPWTPAKA